ncbi:MAG TPA: TetR/AcrR family transcriptional regulator [Mesorhizobium sp.]|jgi:AcrR family transcriptional regulator|nr:TetR/AcrR family transcriptional regulator [Mesorhizobium sp.]
MGGPLAERTPSPGDARDAVEARRGPLSREAWIAAARRTLEAKGVAQVKIDRVARELGVTRGSFYFHFQDLRDLQDCLQDEWRRCNVEPFHRLSCQEVGDGQAFIDRVTDTWVRENPFSPLLDLAIRDWARSAPALAAEFKAADELRMSLLSRALEAMGYESDESLVRARITYLHQIGYYALGFRESRAERERLLPFYRRVLVGQS